MKHFYTSLAVRRFRITFEKLKTFSIIVEKDAPECLKYIASLLQTYFIKTTGITMEITDTPSGENCIYIGRHAESFYGFFNDLTLKKDAFYCSFYHNSLYLVGKNDRATMYAVWYFIDKYLKVKYLYREAETVNKLNKVYFPKFDYINPPFDYRSYLSFDTYNDKEPKDNILENVVKTGTKDYFTEITDKYGKSVGIYGRGNSHNFHFYVPVEKYLKTHPEFYFFSEGENGVPTIDITNGLNDDGSIDKTKTETVVNIVIEELKKDLREHPEIEILVLTQEDGSEYFNDEHNKRLERKYKRSGLLVRFCNAVIRELNAWAKTNLNGKQVKLLTFAYEYTKHAPVKTENDRTVPIDETVVCDENLIIQMAYFPNGYYDYFSKKQFPEILNDMKQWKVVAKDMWFWGYDISYYNYFVLYDSFHNIKKNVEGFKKYGVSCLFMLGAYNQTYNWQTQIRGYVYRKLMMGYRDSVKKLYNEFLNNYYGLSSKCVKKVIKIFHVNYKKIVKHGYDLKFECINYSNHIIYKNNPIKMLKRVISLIDKAEIKIKKSLLYTENEKQMFLKRLYAVKATPLNILYINADYNGIDGGKEKSEKIFVDCARRAEINNCAETLDFDVFTKFIKEEFNEKIGELS